MNTIKQKPSIEKTIKAIDKSAVASEKMKNALVKTKEKAENSYISDKNSPNEYAVDNMNNAVNKGTTEAANNATKVGEWGFRETKRSVSKGLEKFKDSQIKKKLSKPIKSKSPLKPNSNHTYKSVKSTSKAGAKTLNKSVKEINKTAVKTIKKGAKGTVKTATKTVKTAEKTARTTIKTAKATAKTAKATAQATAKAAKVSFQVAKLAAKASAATAKILIKAAVAAVKAILLALKSLIAILAAGGWVVLLFILVICLLGLIVGSGFGIFYSGDDTGTGMSMPTAVSEINAEYQEELEKIKNTTVFDVLEMSGSRAVWREVLSVYAVKTTTDDENAQEVASMDEEKLEILKEIFWDMNSISSSIETKSETIIETTNDEDGNIIETEVEVTKAYLYITVTHKTADEMASELSFDEEQKEILAELLSDEHADLWSSVLYGIDSGGGEAIVAVALSQVGNIGGEPYWSWYGFGGRVEWCATFVSWCANELGYIEAGVIPKFAAVTSQGVPWFKYRGLWQDNSYEPRPGDIIFFNWDGDHLTDHVGIVEKCENGIVYTIEGNNADACRQQTYPVGSSDIAGYGVPEY